MRVGGLFQPDDPHARPLDAATVREARTRIDLTPHLS
jgi:hypothetical protein